MIVSKITRDALLLIKKEKKISLEGNILKILQAEPGDEEFEKYLLDAIEKDKEGRRRRLEITKQVQARNLELVESEIENKKLLEELNVALENAENSKSEAEQAKDDALMDLDILQKKSQFELIGSIVKISLVIICGVGVITTVMYGLSILNNSSETHVIGTAWSNMLGILLTNAFSIVGTIMGVKYASEKTK
jgi:hypothetical protein